MNWLVLNAFVNSSVFIVETRSMVGDRQPISKCIFQSQTEVNL